MSDAQFREIVRLATEVALQTPYKARHGSCRVQATTIVAIRAELDKLGIPWRKYHPNTPLKDQ